MNTHYLDTSAAVKLYVDETGSDWLRQLLITTPPGVVLCSVLLRVEMRSAFTRRLSEGAITPAEYARLCDWFNEHCATLYRFSPVNETIIQSACGLVERHRLRGYDAVHLATALTANQLLTEGGEQSIVFLSADERLILAARLEGLEAENPNNPR